MSTQKIVNPMANHKRLWLYILQTHPQGAFSIQPGQTPESLLTPRQRRRYDKKKDRV